MFPRVLSSPNEMLNLGYDCSIRKGRLVKLMCHKKGLNLHCTKNEAFG